MKFEAGIAKVCGQRAALLAAQKVLDANLTSILFAYNQFNIRVILGKKTVKRLMSISGDS